MNWEAIGAIGEGLGAIGVIVTLVYLVGQVRTSNRLLRADSERSSTESMNQTALKLAENRDLQELFSQGLIAPDELDRTDKGRFTWLFSCLIGTQHTVWTHFELGLVTLAEVGDMRAAYGDIIDTPGGRWWWKRARCKRLWIG